MEVAQETGSPGKCTADSEVLATTALDTKKLDDILPKQFKHHIVRYEDLENPDHFKAEIRVNIFSKEEALEWLREFEEITCTNFRTRKTFKENSNKLIFKKLYRCHKNTGVPKSKIVKRPSERNVGCNAMLCITVKNTRMKWSSDVLLQDYPCIIGLKHSHCHSLTTPDTLRYRRPLPELKEKFAALFAEKISPSTALKIHKLDLQRQYGEKYSEIVNDSAKCPHLHWVYKLYYTIYQKGVKEGKRKCSRKASGVKRVKIKEEPDTNIKEGAVMEGIIPGVVYVPGRGVCEELISDVDISIISETRQIEIGNSSGDSKDLCEFEDDLNLPSEEMKTSIDDFQQCDSDEFVLFGGSDTSYADDSQMGADESLDHNYVQVEPTVIQTEQSDRSKLLLKETSPPFAQTQPSDDGEGEGIGTEIDSTEEKNMVRLTFASDPASNSTQECINNIEKVFCDIKIRLENDPGVFTSPALKFISKYEELAKSEDQDDLASALENFGLKPTVVNAIANFARTFETGQDDAIKPETTEQNVSNVSEDVLPIPPKKRKVIFVKLTKPPVKKIS